MTAKLRLVFTITMVFASFWGYTQDICWTAVSRADKDSRNFIKDRNISKSKVFSINESLFKGQLVALSQTAKNKVEVYFPDDSGTMKAFYVQESSVMAPELAAKYPLDKVLQGCRGRG